MQQEILVIVFQIVHFNNQPYLQNTMEYNKHLIFFISFHFLHSQNEHLLFVFQIWNIGCFVKYYQSSSYQQGADSTVYPLLQRNDPNKEQINQYVDNCSRKALRTLEIYIFFYHRLVFACKKLSKEEYNQWLVYFKIRNSYSIGSS